jgi:hypothetical protein
MGVRHGPSLKSIKIGFGHSEMEDIWAKRDEDTGEWRRLYNEQLHSLYAAPDILRVIKIRMLSWARQVARMTDDRIVYRVLVGNLQGR